MCREKKETAHYHLPGLFEFYDLYKLFLPLFYEHRDYFYDWCDIGSIYGAPADCIWGGGRVGSGEQDPREVLALTQTYGISARLTFSNSLLREGWCHNIRNHAHERGFPCTIRPQKSPNAGSQCQIDIIYCCFVFELLA